MCDREYDPSPVPSDADLWPGELPFTAWDQFEPGMLDLRVFDQDVYWVDVNRVPHRLAEMSDEYIGNVIAHLEEHCLAFYVGTLRRASIQMLGDLMLGRIPSDVVAGTLGAPQLTDLTPQAWLEATPLMRALRRRARDA